ncbi:MAG: ribosome biogenesis factor YjgA [Gammaproteobacteria bacterium]|jgi:ribosome-associated protein|nr:ribosome biogenesis factor YjgA [Gammaproteobacteria bacterium]MDP6732169.1 ribosome biogenesis factor YjgA [Gammaproteobacteria bacterium]|tara:strand:- start:325 stop:822 length:498 start_codon:yes stop_codon:yes gene_type:complete
MSTDDYPESQQPSKTQRKKDALALQKLGQQLTRYSHSQLTKLPLTERVVIAIMDYNRLPNSHGAKKRQLQYIGRLMRDCDFQSISHAVNQLQMGSPDPAPIDSLVMQLCDRILQGGDSEIHAIVDGNERLERQKLRQFYRDFSKGGEQQCKIRQKLLAYIKTRIA